MANKSRLLLNNFYRPNWWRESALPYARAKIDRHLSRLVYSPSRNPLGLMETDWDNIIILDACRYDLFTEANTLDGELDYRISLGSATPEFLTQNFAGETYHDTVYVTANPMYRTRELGNVFHDVIDVWSDHWDEQKGTVLPSAMFDATVDAHEQYPNKRILSHFMQPHYPFIGELAEEIGEHAGYELTYQRATEEEGERERPTVWRLLEQGEITHELAWNAYRENLEVTLPYVESLIESCTGKTVITSDHGNMLGERPFLLGAKTYGHPKGMRTEPLCKVPWLVVESEKRKRIVEESPTEQVSDSSKEVSERLADLGYAD